MSHIIPLLIADHTHGKKVSLIVFKTQFLSKILPVTHILSFTIMTYLKKLTGIRSLNTKQYPAGFSPRIMPSTSVSSKVYPSSYQKTAKIKWF